MTARRRSAARTARSTASCWCSATSARRSATRLRRDFLAQAERGADRVDGLSRCARACRAARGAAARRLVLGRIAESGVAEQLAVAHVDPSKVEFARELNRRYPPDPNAPTGVPNVIRTGTSELYPEISREMLERGARDAEHLRIIRELDLRSAMIVPLRGRGARVRRDDVHLRGIGPPLRRRTTSRSPRSSRGALP